MNGNLDNHDQFENSAFYFNYFGVVDDVNLRRFLKELRDIHDLIVKQLGYEVRIFNIEDFKSVGCVRLDEDFDKDNSNYLSKKLIFGDNTAIIVGIPSYKSSSQIIFYFDPNKKNLESVQEFILELIRSKLMSFLKYSEHFDYLFSQKVCELINEIELIENRRILGLNNTLQSLN